MCVSLVNGQSVTVRIEFHRLRGTALAELKGVLAPIRKERTHLFLEHESEFTARSETYREERQKLVVKEDRAKLQFLRARTPEMAEAFAILLGVPFLKRFWFNDRDIVFTGAAQPVHVLYRPLPGYIPDVIPCKYRITYGDRVLVASANPGGLAMGTQVIQLARSGLERVYLVIEKEFTWQSGSKAIDRDKE